MRTRGGKDSAKPGRFIVCVLKIEPQRRGTLRRLTLNRLASYGGKPLPPTIGRSGLCGVGIRMPTSVRRTRHECTDVAFDADGI